MRALRRQAGLTQAELAARSGLRPATISALENGRSRAHAGTLLALAAALGTADYHRRQAARMRE